MSILIKGMEMPKNCFWCPLSVLSDNRLFCEVTKNEVVRAKIDVDCPLVPVPPHGFDFTREDTDKMLKALDDSEKLQMLIDNVACVSEVAENIKNGGRIE